MQAWYSNAGAAAHVDVDLLPDDIRCLVVRWERLAACFEAFLVIATIHIWLQRLIVG